MAEKEKKTEEKKEVDAEEVVAAVEVAKLELEKNVIEGVPEEKEAEKQIPKSTFDIAGWTPKTSIGKAVKAGAITDIDEILDNGSRMLESQIVDVLLPSLESDLLMIGQSKGKFGGGQRRVFRQTQKKTKEGNKPKFTTYAVIGNRDGYVGMGLGKSKETVPAREKALRNAKLGIFKVRRGCGSWQCGCATGHSLPYKVKGKCGSVEVEFIPAPRGTGLCMESECAKILALAGFKDAWSRTKGQTRSAINLVKACEDALKQLTKIKTNPAELKRVGAADGRIKKAENE